METELQGKLCKNFSGMVVKKTDLKSVFGTLNIPSYVRDWFVRKYSDQEGNFNAREGLRNLRKIMPEAGEWTAVLDKIMEGEQVKILARTSIKMSIKTGQVSFTLPDYGVTENDTYISPDVWNKVKGSFLSENEGWGIVVLGYTRVAVGKNFVGKVALVDYADFRPYNVELDYYKKARSLFTTEEWIDIMLGSIDYNADGFASEEQKLTMLKRLMPFVQARLNLIELAPKGTGKSYLFSQISKHGWLVSGGSMTRAKLFYDMQQHREGLITRYDYIAFDEISTMTFPNEDEMKSALKGYLENGKFTVGNKTGKGTAGLILLGNINQSDMNVNKNMFTTLPDIFAESALLDRFHGFIEGWKIPRLSESIKMNGWAINSEYFSDVMHKLRDDETYANLVNQLIVVPNNADMRDTTAVKRLAEAFIKILFPHWQAKEDVNNEEFVKYCLTPAVEMRAVIRKQLSILDSEYPSEMNVYTSSLEEKQEA